MSSLLAARAAGRKGHEATRRNARLTHLLANRTVPRALFGVRVPRSPQHPKPQAIAGPNASPDSGVFDDRTGHKRRKLRASARGVAHAPNGCQSAQASPRSPVAAAAPSRCRHARRPESRPAPGTAPRSAATLVLPDRVSTGWANEPAPGVERVSEVLADKAFQICQELLRYPCFSPFDQAGPGRQMTFPG